MIITAIATSNMPNTGYIFPINLSIGSSADATKYMVIRANQNPIGTSVIYTSRSHALLASMADDTINTTKTRIIITYLNLSPR